MTSDSAPLNFVDISNPENPEIVNTLLRRQPSALMTNQGRGETCFAHAASRLILNFIRNIISNNFYPLPENDCNNIEIITTEAYTTIIDITGRRTYLRKRPNIDLVFEIIENCDEHNKNNILLFAYIYTVITSNFGCNGGHTEDILIWFKKSFKNNFMHKNLSNFFDTDKNKKLFLNFRSFSDIKYNIIQVLIINFYNSLIDRNIDIYVDEYTLSDSIIDFGLIKYILDLQYYIAFRRRNRPGEQGGHVVTAIGYEIENNTIFINLKNSWGNTNNIEEFGVPHINGMIKIELNELINEYKTIDFLIPQYNNPQYNEYRSEATDELEQQYRREYAEPFRKQMMTVKMLSALPNIVGGKKRKSHKTIHKTKKHMKKIHRTTGKLLKSRRHHFDNPRL
jgi:hypothetical protein